MNRIETISHYQDNPDISVLIVGAGVNGIGTFRDLALQGVDVLMVDKSDFCSGASAASSHMIHGGIRYLENGEFRLVREAIQERNRLFENAPHYVKPLPTVIPIFGWFSGLLNAPLKFLGLLNKPSERGIVVIKIGLLLYDSFTRKQSTVPKHRFKAHAATLDEFPEINPEVLYSAHYYDGSMHTPERICIELILDGEAANSEARSINYVSADRSSGDGIILTDQVTRKSFEVKPRVVINAAGPWIDCVNAKLGVHTHFIGGTKGSHLVIDNPSLRAAIGENEFFFENKDGRMVLIFPLKDKVMIGTSDIPILNPEQARCTEDEIDYFVEMVKVIFPKIAIKREQIVFQFSGVRPLTPSPANNPGQISRDHSIIEIEPREGVNFPIYSLVGGKWTSFRAFSEEVTDKTLAALNLTRKTDTRELSIGGGRGYPMKQGEQRIWVERLSQDSGLPVSRVAELFERYGTRAEQLAAFISQGMDSPLHSLPGYSQRELEFIAKEEKIVHMDDFFLRRSMIAKLGGCSNANIDEVSKIFNAAMNWSTERSDSEIKRTLTILRDRRFNSQVQL